MKVGFHFSDLFLKIMISRISPDVFYRRTISKQPNFQTILYRERQRISNVVQAVLELLWLASAPVCREWRQKEKGVSMPDLSRMWKLWKQTTRIRDKGSELRSEHPPASSDMDDG